jgi:hypothetical protein
MNDPFDLPPERELPDSVRAEARLRVMSAVCEPGWTLGWAPIAAAAAVVLGALAAVSLGGGTSGRADYIPPAAGFVSPPSPQPFRPTPPEKLYDVLDHQAPPDEAARCVAAGAAGWQPLLTASARGVTVIAYGTGAGPRFCELTPSTVTVSAPIGAASAPGAAKATFVTQSGTVAGVLDPSYRTMQLGPGDKHNGRGLIVVQQGIFVAPNGLPPGKSGLDLFLGGSPDVMGGERYVPPADIPTPAQATVDRPQKPADRKSDGGRRLADCFTRNDSYYPVDAANWQATESVPVGGTESLQLGRYGNLLAVCVFTGNEVWLHIDEGANSNGLREEEEAASPYLFTTTVFYNFKPNLEGTIGSGTVAVTGLVKSAEVKSVSISRPESPDVVATVHNGTFVLPGINLNEGPLEEHGKSVITVHGAAGVVLAQLPIHV